MRGLTRRGALAAPLLTLAACRDAVGAPPATPAPTVEGLPPLKDVAPFSVGCEIPLALTEHADATRLLLANFDQITANTEMKMEDILQADGSLDFAKAEAIAAFAAAVGLGLHGHTLIWHIYAPDSFKRLAGDKARFLAAYGDYIRDVAGRFRGRVRGWDVVNEPVAEDGEGFRDCIWRRALGMDYVPLALHAARAADPEAVLFVNEYNLESKPRKRLTFLRLVEDLLKQGAPLTGLGTQMHMGWSQPLPEIAASIRELAAFGLPIHVSELDVQLSEDKPIPAERTGRRAAQARVVGAAAEAFAALPRRQQYAFTVWGLRDSESWLRLPQFSKDVTDEPLLFDGAGKPKAMAEAFVRAVQDAR